VVDQNINHYLYRKRGVYYFSRRIPLDLQDQYSQTRIAASLKTKSLPTARRGAQSLAHQLDDYWMSLNYGLVAVTWVDSSAGLPLIAMEIKIRAIVAFCNRYIQKPNRK